MTDAPERLSALEARTAIDAGRLSATDLLEACLERATSRHKTVRAFVHIDAEGARRAARRLDAGPAGGLLHGLPFCVKDIVDSHDQPTAYGALGGEANVPPWDGAAIALSRRAGAVLLGKTTTTELVYPRLKTTRNPLRPTHTPGGSSSGSAAAVADCQVPFGIGAQTSGSLLRPAAFCGITALKPTFQHIGNAGVRTNTEAFDTLGPMARTVADLALLRAALMGIPYAPVAPESVVRPRIAICRTPYWDRAEPATVAAMARAHDAFAVAGARLVDFELPDEFARLEHAHARISNFESARNYAHEEVRAPDAFSADFMTKRMGPGLAVTMAQFREAMRLVMGCRRWLDRAFVEEGIDAILTPSAAGEAPAGLTNTGTFIFNLIWSDVHTPAVTVPAGEGEGGLPVGVQLVGRMHEDARLLDLAAWAERRLAAQ
ncbi:amidase [Acuticoccus sp. M5D2P5]|uniref:amidase n=1 Tax=Acuticoccus kalidii TaxID=2910977 RepID=UPI001F2072C5|nr:amidase [Acuticoccus kalidii]MCF3936147.1 amidase [Acuticoccus kalidii]